MIALTSLYLLGTAIAVPILCNIFLHPEKGLLSQSKLDVYSDLRNQFEGRIEEVGFVTPDDISIRGILIRPIEGNRTVIIICHGISDDKYGSLGHARFLAPAGFGVLLFDFRNFGESGGNFSTYGYYEKQDIIAAIDYLKKRGDLPEGLRIGLFGVSMGAAIAIGAAADDQRVDCLVVDSPFGSLSQIALDYAQRISDLPRFLLWLPVKAALWKAEYTAKFRVSEVSPEEKVRDLSCPIFIIHGSSDRIINVRYSRGIYNNARRDKRLWIIENADHMQTFQHAGKALEASVVNYFRYCTDHHLR